MEMFRGKGVGTTLIAEAENILMDRDLQWATIGVAKDNHGARRLYERLGYHVFMEDAGQWSFIDHQGKSRYVSEPCWLLEKNLLMG
jgi:GNAT superfamily N-acetyltransferase